jgi:hypothetical protein
MIAPALHPPSPIGQELHMAAETNPSERKVIGQAAMLEDGTIVMDLRMEDAKSGAVGDIRVQHKRGDADYQPTLDHLGGLRPGEIKPVYNDWK